MSANEASQPQQSVTTFPWQRAVAEQIVRWDAVVTANAEEATRLTTASMSYANQLAAQWRKLAREMLGGRV